MAATCNVFCKVDYDYMPSGSITSSTALFKYRAKDPSNPSAPYTEYTKIPAPSSGDEVSLNGIQSAGEYEMIVNLNVNGATDQKEFTFTVDKCNLSCKEPFIEKVYLEENNQIVMDYLVGLGDFYAVQYQIATDIDFTNIIHVRVIMKNEYTPTEYIEMNDGTIPDYTKLFIRARNYCSPSEISTWSNVVGFASKKWVLLYPFDFAYLVPGKYKDKDPRDIGEGSICRSSENPFVRKVYLTTPVPQIGTFIYNRYSTPARPAVKGDLLDFEDQQNANNVHGFNEYGILWVRFEKDGVSPTVIYDVEPDTGKIISISQRFTCNF